MERCRGNERACAAGQVAQPEHGRVWFARRQTEEGTRAGAASGRSGGGGSGGGGGSTRGGCAGLAGASCGMISSWWSRLRTGAMLHELASLRQRCHGCSSQLHACAAGWSVAGRPLACHGSGSVLHVQHAVREEPVPPARRPHARQGPSSPVPHCRLGPGAGAVQAQAQAAAGARAGRGQRLAAAPAPAAAQQQRRRSPCAAGASGLSLQTLAIPLCLALFCPSSPSTSQVI